MAWLPVVMRYGCVVSVVAGRKSDSLLLCVKTRQHARHVDNNAHFAFGVVGDIEDLPPTDGVSGISDHRVLKAFMMHRMSTLKAVFRHVGRAAAL